MFGVCCVFFCFFFKQKTAYDMRISDWSSDVCSSDLLIARAVGTVEKALLEAAVLAVVLLILFLGDWRAAAIVAATLPLAALITFLFMQGMGQIGRASCRERVCQYV